MLLTNRIHVRTVPNVLSGAKKNKEPVAAAAVASVESCSGEDSLEGVEFAVYGL